MATPEKFARPPLRYRRLGGGYRREDVEFALAELRLTLRQLDNDLESLRDRNRTLESELGAARSEIEAHRGREQQLSQQISEALRRAGDIEESAQASAREIIANAEEVAMRARSEAHKRIEDTSNQFNELLRLKEGLLASMRGVVGEFDHAISRVERGDPLFAEGLPTPAPQPAQPVEAAPPVAIPPVVETPAPVPAFLPVEPPVPAPELVDFARPAPAPAPPPAELEPAALAVPAPPLAEPLPVPPTSAVPEPTPEEQVFETRVELDAGPFSDFASLSSFERALSHLPRVEDVYVRRLADDRALIELTLSEPAPLLRAMRDSLPYAFEVRSANRAKIVVNVFAQSPAGAH